MLATAAGGPPRDPRATESTAGCWRRANRARWADAAARLLDDRPEMERIGAAARASAQRFDRDRYADAIIALYRAIS